MTRGAADFDFWMGRWTVRNRRLRERLKGSTAWDEFESTVVVRKLPGGLGNEDEYRTDWGGGFLAMSFRFFERATGKWAIYWADNRKGTLDPPVIGGFEGDVGVFEGPDMWEGRPVLVRFIWSRVTTDSPRWEQAFSPDGGKTWETNWIMEMARLEEAAAEPKPHGVVEFRRYPIREGERDAFTGYFDAYFPEAFQQAGAIALGQFHERENNGFTWLRGFKDMDARASANAAFYYGPLWKEHRAAINPRILDSDNVLLLRPLRPETGVPVFPAVDPMKEAGAKRGIVVAQVFAVAAGAVEAFAGESEPVFADYRAAGARPAGVLVTLDEANNFPQHPVRSDGPFLVWLGILEDERALAEEFLPLARRAAAAWSTSPRLRGTPETVVLDPTPRSRMRWLDGTLLALFDGRTRARVRVDA